MFVSLKLVTPIKEIESMMLQALSDEMNKRLSTIAEIMKAKFVFYVKNQLEDTDEYDELVNGKLTAEFGLDDALTRVNAIIYQWAHSFEFKLIKIKPKVRTITGGLSISAIDASFADVLKMAESTVFSKGGEVPWLRWLLLDGYKNLIADYDIRYGSYPRSRSGEAQMYKRPGNLYKIPLEFAGTIDDNWVTRTFGDVDTELQKMLLIAVDGAI